MAAASGANSAASLGVPPPREQLLQSLEVARSLSRAPSPPPNASPLGSSPVAASMALMHGGARQRESDNDDDDDDDNVESPRRSRDSNTTFELELELTPTVVPRVVVVEPPVDHASKMPCDDDAPERENNVRAGDSTPRSTRESYSDNDDKPDTATATASESDGSPGPTAAAIDHGDDDSDGDIDGDDEADDDSLDAPELDHDDDDDDDDEVDGRDFPPPPAYRAPLPPSGAPSASAGGARLTTDGAPLERSVSLRAKPTNGGSAFLTATPTNKVKRGTSLRAATLASASAPTPPRSPDSSDVPSPTPHSTSLSSPTLGTTRSSVHREPVSLLPPPLEASPRPLPSIAQGTTSLSPDVMQEIRSGANLRLGSRNAQPVAGAKRAYARTMRVPDVHTVLTREAAAAAATAGGGTTLLSPPLSWNDAAGTEHEQEPLSNAFDTSQSFAHGKCLTPHGSINLPTLHVEQFCDHVSIASFAFHYPLELPPVAVVLFCITLPPVVVDSGSGDSIATGSSVSSITSPVVLRGSDPRINTIQLRVSVWSQSHNPVESLFWQLWPHLVEHPNNSLKQTDPSMLRFTIVFPRMQMASIPLHLPIYTLNLTDNDVIDISFTEDAEASNDTDDIGDDTGGSEVDMDDEDDEDLTYSRDAALRFAPVTPSLSSVPSKPSIPGAAASSSQQPPSSGKTTKKRRPFVLARNRDRRYRTNAFDAMDTTLAAVGEKLLAEEYMSCMVVIPDQQSYTKTISFTANTTFATLRTWLSHWWCWWFTDFGKYAFVVNGMRIDAEEQLLVQHNLHLQNEGNSIFILPRDSQRRMTGFLPRARLPTDTDPATSLYSISRVTTARDTIADAGDFVPQEPPLLPGEVVKIQVSDVVLSTAVLGERRAILLVTSFRLYIKYTSDNSWRRDQDFVIDDSGNTSSPSGGGGSSRGRIQRTRARAGMGESVDDGGSGGEDDDEAPWALANERGVVIVPLGSIQQVVKTQGKSEFWLEIACKDFRSLRLGFQCTHREQPIGQPSSVIDSSIVAINLAMYRALSRESALLQQLQQQQQQQAATAGAAGAGGSGGVSSGSLTHANSSATGAAAAAAAAAVASGAGGNTNALTSSNSLMPGGASNTMGGGGGSSSTTSASSAAAANSTASVLLAAIFASGSLRDSTTLPPGNAASLARKALRKDVFRLIQSLMSPSGRQQQCFAFSNARKADEHGWHVYNPMSEALRAVFAKGTVAEPHRERFFHTPETLKVGDSAWTISHANFEYELCSTYPKLLVVPSAFSEEALPQVAQFRTKGRLPVCVWRHPTNLSVICRSSQPRVGLSLQRSTYDQEYLRALWFAGSGSGRQRYSNDGTNAVSAGSGGGSSSGAGAVSANEQEENLLHVFDARPYAAAMGNVARGAGSESVGGGYKFCEFHFLNIENIHGMRESWNKLHELCSNACRNTTINKEWPMLLDSTGWLTHIALVLDGAVKIAHCVHHRNRSVLIHCSDGWDRTSQLSALAQLLLDPYYRTMRGFQVLIEKEWLSFGHMFARRYGHAGVGKDSDRAPIFLQFVDAVWQVTVQFPCVFEFNERFLVELMDSLFSCEYGTFLMDCQRERTQANVAGTTPSLWTVVNDDDNVSRYINPLYDQESNLAGDGVIVPQVSLRDVQLWRAYYLRYYSIPRSSIEPKSAAERAAELADEAKALQNKIRQLQQQLAAVAAIQLKKQLKQLALDDNAASAAGGGGSSAASGPLQRLSSV